MGGKPTMIKRISIDSDNVCYGPVPNPSDEVFQHLTINSKGRVWLTRYCFGNCVTGYTLKSKEYLQIPQDTITDLFTALEKTLIDDDFDEMIVSDVGGWDALIVLDDEDTIALTGSLINQGGELHRISQTIRDNLNDKSIFVFDASPDQN